jgi:hypothetical protein
MEYRLLAIFLILVLPRVGVYLDLTNLLTEFCFRLQKLPCYHILKIVHMV